MFCWAGAGLLGGPLYSLTGWTLAFTWVAAVVASTVVALPLMIKSARAAICSQNINIGKEVHQGAEVSIRTAPIRRLTLDLNYSYIDRTLVYDFSQYGNVSQVNTSIQILPTVPRNKLIANATLRLPHDVLALASARYEGGITLQDTTYRTAPGNLPYGAAYGTMDLGTIVPIHAGVSLQAGVKNLFDRDYYYTPGYPEPGRNWYFNFRYRF